MNLGFYFIGSWPINGGLFDWKRGFCWKIGVVYKILRVLEDYGLLMRENVSITTKKEKLSAYVLQIPCLYFSENLRSVENIRKLNIGQLCPQPRDQVVPTKTFNGITTDNHDQISNI